MWGTLGIVEVRDPPPVSGGLDVYLADAILHKSFECASRGRLTLKVPTWIVLIVGDVGDVGGVGELGFVEAVEELV